MVEQNQETLFDITPDGSRSPAEQAALAESIKQVMDGRAPIEYAPTATQRFMEDMGGGSSVTATTEPPTIAKPDKRPTSARAGMDKEEARKEDVAFYQEKFNLTGDVQISEEQKARNDQGQKSVEAALAPSNARKIAEDAGNDPRTALALSRARAERKTR